MYTLYGYPGTRSLRVAWALEEIGLEYHYKLVDLFSGAHRHPDYLALTPTGKIPLLSTPQGHLSESAAIVTYLGENHAYHELIAPIGSSERALYQQMMCFMITELEQPLWNIVKHDFILPEHHRLAQMQQVATFEFERAISEFSTLLGTKDYVSGPMFSMADIVAGQLLAWADESKLALPHDNVQAYKERVLSRQAFIKATEREQSAKAAVA
ncbi:glutathione S-transferase family protein [Salinimonas sediminis]|uniref:Glutathione S-transferase family protein n=1 Tax=Salinimonas sediminis TaxID=2303538 RepID=A0A346NPR8_9ALTE|nr:glutathione S-transferase family protein [Salinimonas sediminis]AXR07525.1 glutathione S-transferase family protein [Salinimonas sediminis]